ncbi:hypothetical protein DL768_011109 [Monosporascus sp. mg162]|nr:hypothetical protein DL768_011109 [Monosporascus sp. mg162]
MTITNSWPGNLVGELHCLTKPPNPEKHVEAKAIDIVALHDIQQTTDVPWGTGQSGTWLRQLLPKDIRGARILTFHYATEFVFGGGWENFETAVSELLRSIATARGTVAARRPLVLMCHGLSGLLVEAAVARMLGGDSNYLQLREAIKSVIFLNAPQRQSTTVPWMTLLLRIAQENLLAEPRLEGTIRAWIQKNASSLEKLPPRFKKRSSEIKIISFYDPLGPLHLGNAEELLTLGLKREKKMPRQGCDHQSMAEFTNREDEVFQLLVKELKSIIRRANKAKENSAAQGHENTTEAGHNAESAHGVEKAASQRSAVRDTQAPNAHAKDPITATLTKRKSLPQQTFKALKPQQAGPPPDTTGFSQIQYPTGQFARTPRPPGLLATHSVAPLKAETNKVLVQKDSVKNHQTSSVNVFPVCPSPVNTPAPTRSKPATRVGSTTTKTEHRSSHAGLLNAQQQSLRNVPPPRREKVSEVLPGTIRAMPPTLVKKPITPHIKLAAQKPPLPAASLPSTNKEPRPLKASSPTPAHSSRNITAAAGGLAPQYYPKPAQRRAAPAAAQHVHDNTGQQHNTPSNWLPKANNSGFFGKLFSSSSLSSNGSKESIPRPARSPGLHQFHGSQQPQRPQAISRPPNETTARARNMHPPFHHGSSAPPPQAAHRNGFGGPAASQQQRSHHTPSALVPGGGSNVNNTHGSNNTSHNIPSSMVPGGRNSLNSFRGPAANHNNYGGQVPTTHHANTSHPFNLPRNDVGTHSPLGHNDSRHHAPTHAAPNPFQQYTHHPQSTGINSNGHAHHHHHPQYHHDPPNTYYDYRHPAWDGDQHHHPSSSDGYLHSHTDANGSGYEPSHQGNSSNGKIGLAAAVGVGGLAVGAAAPMAIGNIGDDSDVDNSEGEEEEEGSDEEEVDCSEEEEEEEEDEDEDEEVNSSEWEGEEEEDEEEVDTSEEEGVYNSEEGEEEYGEAELYG